MSILSNIPFRISKPTSYAGLGSPIRSEVNKLANELEDAVSQNPYPSGVEVMYGYGVHASVLAYSKKNKSSGLALTLLYSTNNENITFYDIVQTATLFPSGSII